MAQTRVTGPEDIFNTLNADAQFVTYLGEYDFTDGATGLPAFSIITPNIEQPNLKAVRGLEVVIHDTGLISRRDYITSDVDILTTYQVYLILWSDGYGLNLTRASERICALFSGAVSLITVPVSQTPNVAMQSIVQIPDNALILA